MQVGIWFITVHLAWIPQEPMHGSLHFSPMHAKLLGHSLWFTHSGLQFGGVPWYPLRQEQDGTSPISRHTAFGPQGDGTQAGLFSGIVGTAIEFWIRDLSLKLVCNNCTFLNFITISERISSMIFQTSANWVMVYNIAKSVWSTTTRTWIRTFLINTRLVVRTFRADCTFRSTTWRATNICW